MLTIIEERYGLVDKSKWPEGEWNEEPDLVKLVDERFYPYLIRRGPDSLGYLCGYMGVYEPSPLWGKGYDSIQNFEVELTFAGQWYDMSPLVWWFGWDHAHVGDLVPGIRGHYDRGASSYKNIQYVMDELEIISIQLKTIEYEHRTLYDNQDYKGKRKRKPE